MEGYKKGHLYFASESVGEGHPDKLCDQVSDGILDACLRVDPNAKVAMETATKTGMVVLLGEVSVDNTKVNFEEVARRVCKEVGFTSEEVGLDCANCKVIVNVHAQDANIAAAVHGTKDESDMGAGDQGLMFGYATDEWDTETLHPYSHVLANKICEEMAIQRKNGGIPWLRPDCKSQVIVEYEKLSNGHVKPIRVYNILISTQHDPSVSQEEIISVLTEKVIKKIVPAEMLVDTKIVINPSGKFDVGGPAADAGLTGRKIIVDTYGGWCPHGGGAFSGKDASKVDRSAAYYGRYVAKSLVANKLAHRVLVQVSYAIGLADPLSIHVDSYGTVKEGLTDDDLVRIVTKNFNFRPGNILKELDLKRPIYQKSAAFGHFGRVDKDFTWETPKMNLKLD
uniref:S-adenosylmethionine synthase n=1 Tax=Strombidium rassoulzadegani TaxID=1082188 RepID=A0A7S3CU85_9SPIT